MFISPLSSAASLASLPASSYPSILLCAFTNPKWIDQFCVMSCRTLFRVSSIKGLCIKLFLFETKVTLLSVYMATVLRCGLKGMLVLPVSSKLLFVRFDCLNSSFVSYICTAFSALGPHKYGRSRSDFVSDFASVYVNLCGVWWRKKV